MAEHEEVMLAETAQYEDNPANPGRRRFVSQALMVSAGVAIAGMFPDLKAAAMQVKPPCSPVLGQELVNPGQITTTTPTSNLLQAVLRVHGEDRLVSYIDTTLSTPAPACGVYKLRAYEGYSGTRIDPAKKVTKSGVYSPGPTFRAKVGDTLQIAFLNHIDPRDFPETPNGKCDTVTDATTGTQIYPGIAPKPNPPDAYPDCFRGSNATNMHFHGTHVSPNAFSDNVLVNILPDLRATPDECEKMFAIACHDYPNPQAWKHQDAATTQALTNFRNRNQARLPQLDKEFPEKNDPTLHTRQAATNEHLVEYDEFPEYWAGCFPYCIRPPKYNPPQYVMGQAPGTHWYHAHKHGSTSIQVFNGMAGALILEGDYDTKLHQTMPGIQEKIFVIQQFQLQANRERTGGVSGFGGGPAAAAGVLVNGQLAPVITMKTNEVQWWRLINATVQGEKPTFTLGLVGNAGGAAPAYRQIAQDGVQFAWQNYASQIPPPDGKGAQIPSFMLAPGNRADILVRAPNKPGTATLVFGDNTTTPGTVTTVATINIIPGTSQITYNQKWPQTEGEYPRMPDFLNDITTVSESRTIKYEMTGPGAQPTINGVTFQDGVVNEVMLLGTQQEWTIENWSTGGNVRHPFHIHVNPFQIIEICDPTNATNPNPRKLPGPWIWWDTFAIPKARANKDGTVTPGYFKMRTHFADFAGKYVDHCHILAHEDRGMMQLIEVIDNKTVVKHH